MKKLRLHKLQEIEDLIICEQKTRQKKFNQVTIRRLEMLYHMMPYNSFEQLMNADFIDSKLFSKPHIANEIERFIENQLQLDANSDEKEKEFMLDVLEKRCSSDSKTRNRIIMSFVNERRNRPTTELSFAFNLDCVPKEYKDYKQFLLSFLQVQIDELSDKNEQIEILYEQKEVA